MRMTPVLLCGLLLLCLAPPASAQVKKWVDAQGRVHYGDRPPVNQKSTVVETGIPAPAAESPALAPAAAAAAGDAPEPPPRRARASPRGADPMVERAKAAAEKRREFCNQHPNSPSCQ